MTNDSFDPKSSKTVGYHLFVEPEGEMADELQDIIIELAQTHNGPVFPPHVTILARIPEPSEESAIEHAKDAALALSPITLTLGEVSSEDMYYRALYSRIKEQEALKVYHRLASTAFEMDPNPDYLPHLSLLYGNYSSETIQAAKNQARLPESRTFVIDKLHLYRTEGEVGEWQKIGEFPLFG